jgi:hypothetical protein
MSILVPFQASGFTAIYYSNIETLRVFASGKIPGWVLAPHLERDFDFVGGLKFSLLGYAGGAGGHAAQQVESVVEVSINLPDAPIHKTSVTCESADGKFNIDVKTYNGEDKYPPPGSNLTPFIGDTASFDANYDVKTKTLLVFARGELAGWVLGPRLYRDPQWVGGFKFDVRSYSGGLGTPPNYHLEASYSFETVLPQDHFQSKEVTIDTSAGHNEARIWYHDADKSVEVDASKAQEEPTPGSILVPLPESGFRAVYVSKTKTLTIFAEGDVPGWILDVHLERDVWVGGLKFSLRGFPGGIPAAPEKGISVAFKLAIALPAEHFQSETGLVESETGTFKIPINYAGVDEANGS